MYVSIIYGQCSGYIYGRVLTILFDLVEPQGKERGCLWSFVLFLDKIRVWVHPECAKYVNLHLL